MRGAGLFTGRNYINMITEQNIDRQIHEVAIIKGRCDVAIKDKDTPTQYLCTVDYVVSGCEICIGTIRCNAVVRKADGTWTTHLLPARMMRMAGGEIREAAKDDVRLVEQLRKAVTEDLYAGGGNQDDFIEMEIVIY